MIAIYFLAVIGIGIYLKRFTSTGEDFFLAAAKTACALITATSFMARPSFLRKTFHIYCLLLLLGSFCSGGVGFWRRCKSRKRENCCSYPHG